MTLVIGVGYNTNDEATVKSVSVGSSTAVTLVDANPDRISFRATIDGQTNDRTLFIRYYPAATDNTKHGNVLTKKLDEDGSFFRIEDTMTPGNIYTGEISAIALSGTVTVYVTEY